MVIGHSRREREGYKVSMYVHAKHTVLMLRSLLATIAIVVIPVPMPSH